MMRFSGCTILSPSSVVDTVQLLASFEKFFGWLRNPLGLGRLFIHAIVNMHISNPRMC